MLFLNLKYILRFPSKIIDKTLFFLRNLFMFKDITKHLRSFFIRHNMISYEFS